MERRTFAAGPRGRLREGLVDAARAKVRKFKLWSLFLFLYVHYPSSPPTMLISLLLPITLAAATAIPRDLLSSVVSSITLPGVDLQLNQATSPAKVLDTSTKLLLGGQITYIAAQTLCLPGDVKARTCGGVLDVPPADERV